jgi:hypothetical protein
LQEIETEGGKKSEEHSAESKELSGRGEAPHGEWKNILPQRAHRYII